MASSASFKPENRLLRHLQPDDRTALLDHLDPVELGRGDVLIRAHEPIKCIVFPETGIVSVVADTGEGRRIEIGIFGREGMADGSLLVGVDQAPYESFVQVQVPGHGLRIAVPAFLAVMNERPGLSQFLQRYTYVFSIQAGQTALSNSGYTVEERLARWLLMCQDRVGGDELSLTHEFLGMMLAVRRSGVTLALQLLEGSKVIEARRGHITILDREALTGIAGTSYGVAEAEYERVIGPMRRSAEV